MALWFKKMAIFKLTDNMHLSFELGLASLTGAIKCEVDL